MTRSDKGKERGQYNTVGVRKVPNNTGKKYKLRTVESRGQQPKEPKITRAFWREYTMDKIIQLSPVELETLLDEFYTAYEKRQKKAHGDRWWYPEDPRGRFIDIMRKQ